METKLGVDDALAPDDADATDFTRVEDRRHLDAAVTMVGRGSSRWVMVCGLQDADALAGPLAKSTGRVDVRVTSPTSILVIRADPDLDQVGSRPLANRVQGRLAHVAQVLSTILR